MKPIYHALIAICSLLLFSGQVQAQHSGPYIGALIGGNELVKAKSSDNLGDFALEYKPGISGTAVLGWDFEQGNPVGEGRIELEYSRRSNQIDKAKFVEGDFKGGGNMTADSLLINFIGIVYDKSLWYPYALLGVGAARVVASDLTVTGDALAKGSDSVLAYQLGGGLDFVLTEHLNLDLGYRFFGTARPKFTEANGQSVRMDYHNHSALIGLRVGF
jgi:opacity protein-like surface antigen